ncbi:MAG: M28 family peptidase [Clostridia bacterium]|nr:M28 family peptidase [Clostridia bacterium]
MTDFTRIIFEKHEIRKSRKQKDEFIISLSEYANALGYQVATEKGSLGTRNVIIGNPETAKVVFTAHYDTCAVMPFPNFITPKNIGLYLLYQMFVTAILLLPSVVVSAVVGRLVPDLAFPVWYITFIITYFLFVFGPANKHTANDNTSGVTVITDLMGKLSDGEKDEAAFILFDFEEAGMLGSSSYNSKHKKMMKDKLLINFDCVSDGKDIIFVLGKGAQKHEALIESSFVSKGEFNVVVAKEGVFYPSDQIMFRCGVGVAALKRTGKGILYMDRIHTKKDTVYQTENIEFLTEGSVRLIKNVNK